MGKKAYIGVNGTAHQVKKIYIGVDDYARKIKKGYIGVNGIARMFFSDGLSYYGTAPDCAERCSGVGAATVGDYAIFVGNDQRYVQYLGYTAYNNSLTKTILTPIATGSQQRWYYLTCGSTISDQYAIFFTFGGKYIGAYDASLTLFDVESPSSYTKGRCANVGNYVLFGGGQRFGNSGYLRICTAYDTSLTLKKASDLTNLANEMGAGSNGKYALFAGGFNNNDQLCSTVDAYNASLTKKNAPKLTTAQEAVVSANMKNMTLFALGDIEPNTSSGENAISEINIYDQSLTHSSFNGITFRRKQGVGGAIGEYALFAGGTFGNIHDVTDIVDVFNESLTKEEDMNLSVARFWNAIGQSATVGNRILIAGGTAGGNEIRKVDVFQI